MMRKHSGSISLFNSTLVALLIGGVIFVIGYTLSLNILRSKIMELTSNSVLKEIESVNTFIDQQLSFIEEYSFAFTWSENRHGTKFVADDWTDEKQTAHYFELLISNRPYVSGVTLALHPEQKIFASHGKYGYALHITNAGGRMVQLPLGTMYDYSKEEWFKGAYESNDVCWSRPYREANANQIIASFSMPFRDEDGNAIGVFAMDFNLRAFHDKCNDISSVDGSIVSLLDKDFRFVTHPDSARLFASASDDGSELWQNMLKKHRGGVENGVVTGSRDGTEYALYFSKVKRTGWIICLECPMEEIYSDVNEVKAKSVVIAVLSVLVIAACIIFLFRRMRRAVLTQSGMEADMKIARELQMDMLPKRQPAFPERKDMDIYGLLQPAKKVGGDLYDYMLRDDRLFFCIGDVSGKGVPAAMFMSIVMSYFHNKCRKVDSASEFVSSLNGVLASQQSENMFCTFFFGILNLRNGRLDYCNAGHDAPIMIRRQADGHATELLQSECNLVVGALEDIGFMEDHVTMRPGDSLFLFTDGVTEAENRRKELFGVEATIDGIRKIYGDNGDLTASEKVGMMLDELHRHTGNAPQSDDITMLLVEYKGTTIALENKLEQLTHLSEFVRNMCGQHGVPDEIVDDIDVALDEIGANISMYAFPKDETHSYCVSFHHEADELVFTFEDDGVPFDPTQPTDSHLDLPPEERPPGGLGIMMVKGLMDRVEYERRDDKNIVCIVKKYEIPD